VEHHREREAMHGEAVTGKRAFGRIAVAAAVLVGLAGLAGCSTPRVASATGPPVASTSVVPSPGLSGHPLGETVDADHSFVQATVFAYRQPVAPDAPRPGRTGFTWGAVDAQTCASPTSVFGATVTSLPWLLVYADGTTIAPIRVSYRQFPQPVYPSMQRGLQPGQCLRAWIVFAVPAITRPLMVRYAPFQAIPVNWAAY
jgi:hypothetical protein